MVAVGQLLGRIAPTDTTVLVTGESGTGKELVARAIHHLSLRAHGPFVAINCGVFTETLLESELFGHVRGAFTHAVADRAGLFSSADGGTLFLDEIGDMSAAMQVKLLRVLETRALRPVGGNKDVKIDVRIIAATNCDLARMVAFGEFREDLFHRLNVIPIELPPLRERKQDIPLLAGRFLARFATRMNKKIVAFDPGAMERLMEFDWPGNVRELENVIERAVAFCTGERIATADIVGLQTAAAADAAAHPERLAPVGAAAIAPIPAEGLDLEGHLLEVERAYIIQALERTNGNMTEAARLLGMSFRSLRYRVAKLGIGRTGR
jgi:two-component system response regulator PilR (NtrC family)